jgi:hypothetical protein
MGFGTSGFIMTSTTGAANTSNVTQANIEILLFGSVDINGAIAVAHNHDSRYDARYLRVDAGNETSLSGDVTGKFNTTVVGKLKGFGIDFAGGNAPALNEVLTYDGTNWISAPAAAGGITGISGDSTAAQTLTYAMDVAAATGPAWIHNGTGDHKLTMPPSPP